MITHTLKVDEINKGLDLMHEGKSIRSVVVYWRKRLVASGPCGVRVVDHRVQRRSGPDGWHPFWCQTPSITFICTHAESFKPTSMFSTIKKP